METSGQSWSGTTLCKGERGREREGVIRGREEGTQMENLLCPLAVTQSCLD